MVLWTIKCVCLSILSFPLKIQLFCGKLPLCVTWFYSLTALNTLFFFHIFSVLTPTWCGEFFWSCVFAILCASCARITLSFHPLEYFSEVLLKIFSLPLEWNSLFFLMLIVIEFAFSWHTKILHALLTHLRKLSLTLAKWSDSSTPSSSWHSVLHTSHSVHQGVLWAFYLSTVLLVS